MITKAERNGAVMAADLETPDTDHPLTTRRKESPKTPEAVELERYTALLARIEAARTLHPQPKELHCMDCFQRGRDAAIRLIEGER